MTRRSKEKEMPPPEERCAGGTGRSTRKGNPAGYDIIKWRSELERGSAQSGVSLLSVCQSLGMSTAGDIGFYQKIPRKRSSFIGIGIVLGQSAETIDRWLCTYSKNRRLYVKDIGEDLIWLHLIYSAEKVSGRKADYYYAFQECREAVLKAYEKVWTNETTRDESAEDLKKALRQVEFDPSFRGIQKFVADHTQAFATAWAEPRQFLKRITDSLLEYVDPRICKGNQISLNTLRGYLDDSMINFLSGDPQTIFVVDRRTRKLTGRRKHIPKGKRTHISLGLALGMTVADLNRYLGLMNFPPLNREVEDEGLLYDFLEEWEVSHPLTVKLKRMVRGEVPKSLLTEQESIEAARQLVHLRQDLKIEYEKRGKKCPYLST